MASTRSVPKVWWPRKSVLINALRRMVIVPSGARARVVARIVALGLGMTSLFVAFSSARTTLAQTPKAAGRKNARSGPSARPACSKWNASETRSFSPNASGFQSLTKPFFGNPTPTMMICALFWKKSVRTSF